MMKFLMLVIDWYKTWQSEISFTFELNPHCHADLHILGRAADNIGNESRAFRQLDQGDDVGYFQCGVVTVSVHSECKDFAITRYRADAKVG